MAQPSTIVAQATPPGAGGIAVVRLSGPGAYSVAARVFFPQDPAKKVENARGYTALFGHFQAKGRTLDEGVALFFRAPRSYTGEDVVELSCHGGQVIAQTLIEACIAAGAAPAGPGEYTKRAFLNGRISLTQAEAVMDVISAAGRQGAALAEHALGGALAKQIGGYRETLLALAGHLAAWVDFPEEDVPALEPAALQKALGEVLAGVSALVESYGAGAVLRQGVDTAIVGSPNVGKSTLLNLLAGFDRAIVTPVAGTTRDVVEQAVMLGGVRLNLFDTAGLRETGDLVEAEGIRRSREKLAQAGLVLAVFDGSSPALPADRELARRGPHQQKRPAPAVRRSRAARRVQRCCAHGRGPGRRPCAAGGRGGPGAGRGGARSGRPLPCEPAAAGRCGGGARRPGRRAGSAGRRLWAGRGERLCGRRAGRAVPPFRRGRSRLRGGGSIFKVLRGQVNG